MTEPGATVAISTSGSVLTAAAVYAGLPLGMGFAAMGVLGAVTGHMRWMIERERKNPEAPALTLRQHLCMLLRAICMAEFIAVVLMLAWIDQSLPWAWGLIICAISSVFASDAIELMWQAVQRKFKKATGFPTEGERTNERA